MAAILSLILDSFKRGMDTKGKSRNSGDSEKSSELPVRCAICPIPTSSLSSFLCLYQTAIACRRLSCIIKNVNYRWPSVLSSSSLIFASTIASIWNFRARFYCLMGVD